MRQRLGDSLRYIAQAVEGRIEVSPQQLAAFLARLERAAVSPMAFGAYCDLVLAVDADDLQSAGRHLGEVLAAANHPGGPQVIDLRDPATDAMSDRYARLVDTDPGMPFRIYPPPAAVAEAARVQIAAAFQLMDAGHPELAAEIRALLREIVLAVGPEDPRAVDFDGASSFMLWGGIVLNARSYPTTLDMVQALAHESGHNLLFGLCTDGPLVENDDRELYASPLRQDPRPMDGLVHATYVSARMHQAVTQLIRSGVLDRDQAAAAETAAANNQRAFSAGMKIIEQHGKLTALGADVMAGALEHFRIAA
jgi:HEXXH motif-containing protein